MNSFDEITEDEAKEVFQYFPFFRGKVAHFSPIPTKLYNRNAYVRIGDTSYVLKRYPQSEVSPRLAFSHEVQVKLHALEFPVARLEQSKYEKTTVSLFDSVYSVHQWVEGSHLDLGVQQEKNAPKIIAEVAGAVGTLHRLMNDEYHVDACGPVCMNSQDVFNGTCNAGLNLVKGKGMSLSCVQKIRLKIKKSDFDRWIIRRIPDLVEMAHTVCCVEESQCTDLGELIPIHNDINWENLIFSEKNDLLALIDFDNLLFGPRQFEVGATAIVIAGPDNDRIQKFIEAYETASGLECAPQKMRVGMILKCLRSIFFSIHSYSTGKIADTAMLQNWCFYLDGCLDFLGGETAAHQVYDKSDLNKIQFSTI